MTATGPAANHFFMGLVYVLQAREQRCFGFSKELCNVVQKGKIMENPNAQAGRALLFSQVITVLAPGV